MMSDHINDKNHQRLYALYSQIEFPEFLKKAELSSEEDVKELPTRSFADQENREFPIHTKADTYLSMAFFSKYGTAFGQQKTIDKILEKAAKLWELDGEREKLQKQLEDSFEKKASKAETIQYIVNGDAVTEVEVDQPTHLQKIAMDIICHPDNYIYETRQKVAQQLLGKVNVFSKEAEQNLQKTAGWGTTTKENALGVIQMRHFALKRDYPEISERFEKMGSFIKAQDDLISPDVLQKVAAALDVIDRAYGLNLRYDDGFQAPERDLITVTLQDSQTLRKEACILANGQMISKQALRKQGTLVKDIFKNVFGAHVANTSDAIEKTASLSKKQADILCNSLV